NDSILLSRFATFPCIESPGDQHRRYESSGNALADAVAGCPTRAFAQSGFVVGGAAFNSAVHFAVKGVAFGNQVHLPAVEPETLAFLAIVNLNPVRAWVADFRVASWALHDNLRSTTTISSAAPLRLDHDSMR